MRSFEEKNRLLAWKWSKKLDRCVRTIKILQVNAFDNYMKSKPTPEGTSEKEWKEKNYKVFKEVVYDTSIISHINKNDYNVDFISQDEGMPCDEGFLRCGFKIWNDKWALSNGNPVYVRFNTTSLYSGMDTAWETNSVMVPPTVERELYETVFPSLLKDMKLIISNLKESIRNFEITEAEKDFNVRKVK